MDDLDSILSDLADDPSDFQREGSLALLRRHGIEYTLQLSDVPGSGPSVVIEKEGAKSTKPISTFIQADILALPRLAGQLTKTLERSWQRRPVPYIDGPAEMSERGSAKRWQTVSKALYELMISPQLGSTHVIQLMGHAGQGKTALLEHLAMEFAKAYKPEVYPTPLLLPVDLLGRYVGTVEDAIAGSLANNYMFPGLSQRDIALSIGRRWIILALDGFDELVARVGLRDAFLRISELLNQLKGSGTILLSARESFFDLYQITSGLRSYLNPAQGSYLTTVVRLLPWTRGQGVETFRVKGSGKPESDFDQLSSAFDHDEQVVCHPFFVTRLADQWLRGERFAAPNKSADRLTKTRYVIETLIQRESREKWVRRDQTPLLTDEGHTTVLGTVAEEMWKQGSPRLDLDDLRLATEIGLSELQLPYDVAQDVIARIPTHAALIPQDRRFAFRHDMFSNFYLGNRMAVLLEREAGHSLKQILSSRELGADILSWVIWAWRAKGVNIASRVHYLNSLAEDASDGAIGANLAYLCALALCDLEAREPVQVQGHTFFGNSLAGKHYRGIHFSNCRFWHLDLSGTSLEECVLFKCQFGDARLDSQTTLKRTKIEKCSFASIEVLEGRASYSPPEIERSLQVRGAFFVGPPPPPPPTPRVRDDAMDCVERFVATADKMTDVPVELLVESLGHIAAEVAKIAASVHAMKEVSKQASGPKKTWMRFTVERQRLLQGQGGNTGDRVIDLFWDELARKYPPR